MEHYEVLVSESFHRDLTNIVYYLVHQLDAPLATSSFLTNVEKTVESLSFMPYRFSLVDDPYLRHKGFRKCIIKNYLLFYRIREENKTIAIHRLLHAKQNWLQIL